MTTYVEARDTIVAYLESALSALPRFYEDTETVDLDSVGDQFLKICIEFADARQATIGIEGDIGQVGRWLLQWLLDFRRGAACQQPREASRHQPMGELHGFRRSSVSFSTG